VHLEVLNVGQFE